MSARTTTEALPETFTPRVHALTGAGHFNREEIGGKAWSIQHMMSLGIPVPPAFVLTTDACAAYHDNGGSLPDDVWTAIRGAMLDLEVRTGCTFGGGDLPLLVSVRSGAATSMPGMMDTVLNLGIDDDVIAALAQATGDDVYAADTARRFREQYAHVVGTEPPADPWQQLQLAVQAVLESWFSPRALAYRSSRGIPEGGGTAVTVQAMVYGNLDDRSGTGVLFSRDPLTGDAAPFGEWLPRGQGEDVVSGRSDALDLAAMADSLPECHEALLEATSVLEREIGDAMDIEFTVQSGRLWLLQSRPAKRAPEAVTPTAVGLASDGIITPAQALDRIAPEHIEVLLQPSLSAAAVTASPPLASGKPACPGIATGVIVTDSDEAADRGEAGESVVLARPTTDPDDVAGMMAAAAVITEIGGATSHAAVVCRELGVPCVVGLGTGALAELAGKVVTIDGTSGTVHLGELSVDPALSADAPVLRTIEGWLREDLGTTSPASVIELLIERRRILDEAE